MGFPEFRLIRIGRRFCTRGLQLATVILVTALLVRYEAIGFKKLASLADAANAAGVEMGIERGDPLLRDFPKARQIAHGHVFADAHYVGNVHWYPFLTPLIVAIVSVVTHWSIGHSYEGASLLLMGADLLGIILFFRVFLGRPGLLIAAAYLVFEKLQPLPSCIYPISAARFLLLLNIAGSGYFIHAMARREERDSKRGAVACGTTLGLLLLTHGASFCCALAMSTVVAGLIIREMINARTRPSMLIAVKLASLFVLPFFGMGLLLFAPQLIHYGKIIRPEAARLYLNVGVYHEANDLHALTSLVLFPRAEAFDVLFCALPLLLERRWRCRLLPLGICIACATVQAHLGFVLHDARHPLIAAFARAIQFAPPHTFISIMNFTVTFAWWSSVAALSVSIVTTLCEFANRSSNWKGLEPTVDQIAMFVLLLPFMIVLIRHPPGEYWVGYEPWPRAVVSFANDVARKTAGANVYMVNDYSLIWMGGVSPLYFPEYLETNPYIEEERKQAQDRLQAAVLRGDDRTANDLLDRYHVIALFAGRNRTDAVIARCGGSILATGPNGLLVYARRRCGPN